MNNNYQKALKKVKCAQEKYHFANCCYQIVNGIIGPTGPQGVEGPTGPQGVQGLQGMVGPTGPKGEVGNEGPMGPAGTSVTIMGSYDNLNQLEDEHPNGNLGDSYLVEGDLYVWSDNENKWVNVGKIKGPQGEIGPIGSTGPQGVQGLQGMIGPMGPTGPRGPAGYALLSAYGGKYNNMTNTLDTQGAGLWSQIPLIETMDNINIINNIENAFKLEQDGVYELNYFLNISANKDTTITFMVRENGVMIPSTVIAKNIKPNEIESFNGNTIVSLRADDVLDMELSATVDNVTIIFGSGITASLSIKKIDEIDI